MAFGKFDSTDHLDPRLSGDVHRLLFVSIIRMFGADIDESTTKFKARRFDSKYQLAQAIAQATGVPLGTVRRHLRSMVKRGLVAIEGGRAMLHLMSPQEM